MLKNFPFKIRCTISPTISLPLACRSVGHFNVFPGWEDKKKRKGFAELFWGIKGCGVFVIDGRTEYLRANEVVVLFSGETHMISAKDDWEYRWLTLDGEMPDKMLRMLGLERKPKLAGPCPHELFALLEQKVEDVSPHGQRSASAVAYEILTLACSEPEKSGRTERVMEKCIGIIKQNCASPDLNVTYLARQVGVHRTSLSKIFKASMKMSPLEYILSVRIGKALRLLKNTDLSVAEVAAQTGFSNSNYFTNVIKKHIGIPPSSFRNMKGA
ncbi:MAG: AraC family transcriptional regulator [Planctomycetes bacterium]|nr:AraC family transcriptional regulator [Planctomycetota bacterium]